LVFNIGAVCFGIVIGYVTYRTLVRTQISQVSDIGAVVAAVGGGAVTGLFDPAVGEGFGYYSIGLLAGLVLFLVLRLVLEKKPKGDETQPTILGPEDESSAARAVLGR
jgi:hypothetical protein